MKKGDARREELLATAERLFCARGYEGTSVQDIIDEMGYSKGGFYHHFDSKLAVLEAICQSRAQGSCERAKAAVLQAQTPVEQLNALLHGVPLWSDGDEGFVSLLIRVTMRDDGALMREKMKRSQLEELQPVLEDVLAAGMAQGVFLVADASAAAMLTLRLTAQFADEIALLLSGQDGAQGEDAERLPARMVACLTAYRAAIERFLLAPFGSVVLFAAEELELLAQTALRGQVEGERAAASPAVKEAP